MPTLQIVQGGQSASFEAGRDAAMRVIAEAYEKALTRLHPLDADERAWFQERLRDARCAAGLVPVQRAQASGPASADDAAWALIADAVQSAMSRSGLTPRCASLLREALASCRSAAGQEAS